MMHITTWTISKEESYGEGKKPDRKGLPFLRSSGRDTDLCKTENSWWLPLEDEGRMTVWEGAGGFPGLRKSAIA